MSSMIVQPMGSPHMNLLHIDPRVANRLAINPAVKHTALSCIGNFRVTKIFHDSLRLFLQHSHMR